MFASKNNCKLLCCVFMSPMIESELFTKLCQLCLYIVLFNYFSDSMMIITFILSCKFKVVSPT